MSEDRRRIREAYKKKANSKIKTAASQIKKTAELEKLTGKLSEKELEMECKKKKLSENIDEKYELNSQINTYNINNENIEKITRSEEHTSELQSH